MRSNTDDATFGREIVGQTSKDQEILLCRFRLSQYPEGELGDIHHEIQRFFSLDNSSNI
jgi:hypothetical protein